MRYLLDTNLVSEAIRKPNGKIARKLSRMKSGSFGISVIVACEIRFGIEKKPSEKISAQIRKIVRSIPVLDFPAAAADCYGAIRADLERRGEPIGSNDMLIAAHAIHANLILVSDNTREFQRIPGLKLQNWLRD